MMKMTKMNLHKTAGLAGLMTLLAISAGSSLAEQTAGVVDVSTLMRIRDAALKSDYAYERLTELTDQIGPRLSGSLGAEAAVTLVAEGMRRDGLQVSLPAVKVPHWVRGIETAELVEYAHRPAGLTQKVVLTALGGSAATAAAGLTAPVVIVHSEEELQQRAAEIKGRIVLFDVAYDQHLADNGHAGEAYGDAGWIRFYGPARASRLGAAAALVRSVGGADYRLPHTGMTGWDGAAPIPAAAVTAEDAMLMSRLAAKGAIQLHLTLTPQTLPDADSHNVIGEIGGSDKAAEIVIVSGHLDSWDLAQGAIDDGAGLAAALGVADVFQQLGLKPRRTVRIIGWMNEENGVRGGKAYFAANQLQHHFAAIESDIGGGRPLGLIASVSRENESQFAALKPLLRSIGAPLFERHEYAGGTDIGALTASGVPAFEPLLDTRSYFSYHHTPADTLDKVEPENLRRQVALLAMLTWYLAEMPSELKHLPAVADEE